jgi:hypothetical protein
MRMSEWRAVVGSEGRYEVSDDGQMRSLTFVGRPRSEPKLLKQRLDRDGYKRLNVVDGGKHTTWRVHRVVAAAFLGPCPDGHFPDHINRDRADNRVANLRYLHWHENGRKFDHDLVKEARDALDDGMTLREAVIRFGISQTHLRRIRDRRHWAHIPD